MNKTAPYATLMVEILTNKDITPIDKLVYMWMRNQYLYFASMKKPYKESTSTIADSVGVSVKSVRNSIERLVDMGYMFKQYQGHNQSCIYTPNDSNIELDKQIKKEQRGAKNKQVHPRSTNKDNIPF